MTFADCRTVVRLVGAHLWQRPARLVLTLLSTVAAACIVVWVVSSYDSLVAKFDEFSDNYLGRYEFLVLTAAGENPAANGPFGAASRPVSAELIDELRSDPAVAVIDPVFQTRARVTKVGGSAEEGAPGDFGGGEGPGGRRNPGGVAGPGGGRLGGPRAGGRGEDQSGGEEGPPATPGPAGRPQGEGIPGFQSASKPNPIYAVIPGMTDQAGVRFVGGGGGTGGMFNRAPSLVGTDAIEPPYAVVEGRWIDPKRPESLEAAISKDVAQQMRVAVGDEVDVTVGGGGASDSAGERTAAASRRGSRSSGSSSSGRRCRRLPPSSVCRQCDPPRCFADPPRRRSTFRSSSRERLPPSLRHLNTPG